jgi:A/G-specific adenine glycosylase
VDARTTAALVAWFARARRAMPWRPSVGWARDPYAALVSEAMLQQTQVSRVMDYFPRFMARFPDVRALAAADEPAVLAQWAGLGYYRRARHLHAAAKAIVERFDARVPYDPADLRTLPGIGRYTAGAMASIVFDRPEPAVDGNVVRVLLRLHGKDLDPAAKPTLDWTWARAGELVRAASAAGEGHASAWNEGLMDLGATICLPAPAQPRCEACPLKDLCIARRENTAARIPRPKAAARVKKLYAAVLLITDRQGRLLFERRGDQGLWAGLNQPPTLESPEPPSDEALQTFARVKGGTLPLHACGTFEHALTHRRLSVTVYRCAAAPCRGKHRTGQWHARETAATLGLSSMHRRALEIEPSGG